ncbi:MAG: PQQ-binding-like beta-propeller repeat protein [Halodesulfurarchaeum sp.]
MDRRTFLGSVTLLSLASGCLRSVKSTSPTGNTTTREARPSTPTTDASTKSTSTSGDRSESAIRWPQYGRDAGNTAFAPVQTGLETVEESERVTTGVVNGGFAVSGNRLFAEESVYRLPFEGHQSGFEFADQGGQMLVHGNRVFAVATGSGGKRGTVSAFDRDELSRVWRTSLEPISGSISFPHGAPAVAESTLFQVTADGYLRALDTGDGSERWRYDLGEQLRESPAIADGSIFVVTENRTIALAADGTERWSRKLDFAPSPVVKGTSLYLHGLPKRDRERGLYALRTGDGTVQWSKSTGSETTVGMRTVAASEDRVYVNTDRSVSAFDRSDGTVVWSKKFTDSGPLSLSENTVFAVGKRSSSGTVAGYRRSTGEHLWTVELDTPVMTEPVPGDDCLYVGAGDGLYRLASSSN